VPWWAQDFVHCWLRRRASRLQLKRDPLGGPFAQVKIIAYLKETFALNAKLRELREYSFVTFALERFFLALQQGSVLTWFIGSRKRAHDRCRTEEDWEGVTKRRGKQVELMLLCSCHSCCLQCCGLQVRTSS